MVANWKEEARRQLGKAKHFSISEVVESAAPISASVFSRDMFVQMADKK